MTILLWRVIMTYIIMHLPPAVPYNAPLPAWWNGGRIYTTDVLHIGVRPAADWGNGVGLTVQISESILPW